jgi:hypothetical protein
VGSGIGSSSKKSKEFSNQVIQTVLIGLCFVKIQIQEPVLVQSRQDIFSGCFTILDLL